MQPKPEELEAPVPRQPDTTRDGESPERESRTAAESLPDAFEPDYGPGHGHPAAPEEMSPGLSDEEQYLLARETGGGAYPSVAPPAASSMETFWSLGERRPPNRRVDGWSGR